RIATRLVVAIRQDFQVPVGNAFALDGRQSLNLCKFPRVSANVPGERICKLRRKRLASLDALCCESKGDRLESGAMGGHYVLRLAHTRASSTHGEASTMSATYAASSRDTSSLGVDSCAQTW